MATDACIAPVAKPISAVWQFICLLAPTVMTGFYVVYALVGLILEGNSKLRWCDEALDVGLLVLVIVCAMNAAVMLYAVYHRLALSHWLWLSPLSHIGLCGLLTLLIAFGSGC